MDNKEALAKIVEADLAEFGLKIEDELLRQEEGIHIMPPMIKINHDRNGAHKFYVEYPPTYDDSGPVTEDWPDTWEAIVIAAQSVRTWFEDGSEVPRCAAADGIPTVKDRYSDRCETCAMNYIGSECKPRQRLFLLREGTGYIFVVSPVSLKHWRGHIKKLAGSQWPLISVYTQFSLEDVQKPGRRYAEVLFGFGGHVDKRELGTAAVARQEFKRWLVASGEEDDENTEEAAEAEVVLPSTAKQDGVPF